MDTAAKTGSASRMATRAERRSYELGTLLSDLFHCGIRIQHALVPDRHVASASSGEVSPAHGQGRTSHAWLWRIIQFIHFDGLPHVVRWNGLFADALFQHLDWPRAFAGDACGPDRCFHCRMVLRARADET